MNNRLVAGLVGLALLVVGVVIGFALRGSDPTADGNGEATPSVAEPASSGPAAGDGTASPDASTGPLPSGEEQVGAAVWYPPQVDEGFALVAAADSSDENRQSADYVVEGTAEDEIAAALDAMASIGGGQVKLLEGQYELARPVQIRGDGVALVGVNVGNGAGYTEPAIGSQLVPADGFPNGEFLVHATGEAYGPLISLIHVDGLHRAQGINVEAIRPTVTLTAVTQSSDVGIRFAGESTGSRPYDGYVLFNRVSDGDGIGILHDRLAGDMLVEGNIVFRNGGDGFLSRSASQMYRVNHAYNNDGVGIRLIPGCVRTRLSSNKWEGNAAGGLSIEGGSAFTVVGDTFAHNHARDRQGEIPAHIQLGVRGDTETRGVMLSGLTFGKGDDANPHLIHFGALAQDIHVGPVTSQGGHVDTPFRRDDGSDVRFYEAIPDPIVTEGGEDG